MYSRKLRMLHAALLWDSSSILVASLSFTLSSDCSFLYPDLVDCMFSLSPGTFFPPSKPFQGEYEDFRNGEITVLFFAERYRKITFLSFVISSVKLTNTYL